MRRGNARGGLTLLEVVVALAIGGIILLGARAELEAIAAEEHREAVRGAVVDADVNGERVLRSLVGRLEVGTPESGPFAGDAVSVSFTSWCDMPQGWLERCNVVLAIRRLSNGGEAVVWDSPTGGPVVLARAERAASLTYLASALDGGHWRTTWGAGITSPLAIGVVLDRDTLIVRVGDRG